MQCFRRIYAYGHSCDEGVAVNNTSHAKDVFLTGLVDSAFSGDRPTSTSRSLYLAVRRSSIHLARPQEQLNMYNLFDTLGLRPTRDRTWQVFVCMRLSLYSIPH